VAGDTIRSVSRIYYVFNNIIANIVKDEIRLRLKLNTLDTLDAHLVTYTECTRRNLPFFGRKFLRFRYIHITKHTDIRI